MGSRESNDGFLFGELEPLDDNHRYVNPVGSLFSGLTFFTTGVVGVAVVVGLVIGAILGLGATLVSNILN
ncbi:MAG: hypothetical protein JW722_05310 [Demequinaceae bacterium]|nr:hypothetical protein [Demequinaceae bacterium]